MKIHQSHFTVPEMPWKKEKEMDKTALILENDELDMRLKDAEDEIYRLQTELSYLEGENAEIEDELYRAEIAIDELEKENQELQVDYDYMEEALEECMEELQDE